MLKFVINLMKMPTSSLPVAIFLPYTVMLQHAVPSTQPRGFSGTFLPVLGVYMLLMGINA